MENKTTENNITPKSRQIWIRVVFLKVGEIDTVQETYEADVIVQAKWRDLSFDHCTSRDVDARVSSSIWNPKLQVQNMVGDVKCRITTEVEFNSKREAFIIESRRIKGCFSEHLELHNFPFDIQDLSLLITSERQDYEVALVEDEKNLSRVNPIGFVDVQEWELRDFVETSVDVSDNADILCNKKKYPLLTFHFVAFRRPGFFIWNIVFVMALISSLSLTTFAVSTNLPQHRLQLTFTLVLTGVAFKFVVSNSLPKIPYLTYLDKHILGCMMILYLVCIWHALVTLLDDHVLSILPTLDMAAVISLGVFFVLFHVTFGLIVIFTSRARKQEIYEAEKLYQAKARSLYGDSYVKLRKKPLRRNIRRSRGSKVEASKFP